MRNNFVVRNIKLMCIWVKMSSPHKYMNNTVTITTLCLNLEYEETLSSVQFNLLYVDFISNVKD
jgi:hypothetical protein